MRDFPATITCPSDSSAGAVDMSRSCELSVAQVVGAKNCSSLSDGDSSSIESLLSYGWLDESTEPLPALTQMSPLESTTGAAPPIQIAPCDWPAAASTVNTLGAPPVSGTAITRPR